MKRPRVLIVANNFNRKDGWSTEAFYLADTLEKMNVAIVERLAIAPKGGLSPRFSILRALLDWVRYFRVLRSADLVVCVCEPLILLCALNRMFQPKSRLVMIGQGTYAYFPFVQGWKRYLFRFFAYRADAFYVISHFTRRFAEQWYRRETIRVFQLGVESTPEKPIPIDQRESTFLFVGEQKERKGVGVLLRAFAQVVTSHPEVRLEFVGKASPHYVELARQLGVKDSVRFLGRISDTELRERYRRVLCNVLPAVNAPHSFEGFGLVHLEANAHGTPTIGCSGTANEEVIVHGVTGFLCEQNSVEDLAHNMRRLLEDRQLQQRISDAAYAHSQQFDWSQVLPRFWESVLPLVPSSKFERSTVECVD